MPVKREPLLAIEKTTIARRWAEELKIVLGADRGRSVLKAANERFLDLREQEPPERRSASFKKHTEQRMLPAFALYQALIYDLCLDEVAAKDLVRRCFLGEVRRQADNLKQFITQGGYVSRFPAFFGEELKKSFSDTAGFETEVDQTREDECRFNVKRCLYQELSEHYGCGLLAEVFCDSDDICYEHLHKDLVFRRTQALARGDALCDFYIAYRPHGTVGEEGDKKRRPL